MIVEIAVAVRASRYIARKGLDPRPWVLGALVAFTVWIVLCAVVFKSFPIYVSGLSVISVAVWLLSVGYASELTKEELETKKKEYQEKAEQIKQVVVGENTPGKERLQVIKTYEDGSDPRVCKADREKLEGLGVYSLLYSGFGLSTLSVHAENVSKACAALGIDEASLVSLDDDED